MMNDIYSQSYIWIIVFLINVLNTPSLEGRPLHVDDARTIWKHKNKY